MDSNNPLTPKKIQRLMYFAEDKSFNSMLRSGNFEHSAVSYFQKGSIQSAPDESSSGLLDLERCEGFGESGIGNVSLSKSTTSFYPGEMTGRSTGTDQPALVAPLPAFPEYGRSSDSSIQYLEKKLNDQTSDVQEIIKHSISHNFSFQSKRDLTADEASLVMREAPVNPNMINMDLKENTMTQEGDPIELSMGSYFKTRCLDFNTLLPSSESPKRYYSNVSMGLNVAEENAMSPSVAVPKETIKKQAVDYTMDTSLDCVPVRQPRTVPKMADLSNILKSPTSNKENMPSPNVPPLPDRASMFKQNCILLDPSKQHLKSNFRPKTEDSPKSDEETFSTTKIRALLKVVRPPRNVQMVPGSPLPNFSDNDTNSSVDIETLFGCVKKSDNKPRTLRKLDVNNEADIQRLNQDLQVTYLKDTKKSDTTSSAGTLSTVVCQQTEIPSVVVTRYSLTKGNICVDEQKESIKNNPRLRSKSPSSKSRSTFSTVQENLASASFSPSVSGTGVAKTSENTSPNNQYKELDKSVDWQELLHSRERLMAEGIAKDRWVEIKTTPIVGFVGVSTPTVMAVTSLTDSWLTAQLEFFKREVEMTIDLPRFPVLLPPGKTEHFTIHITSKQETRSPLPFILYLKDSSIEAEIGIEGQVEVAFQMPILQALSSDGVNRVAFPPIGQGRSLIRSVVLLSDCSADLQLQLTVTEGSNLFTISAVQEIKKSEVTKQLLEHQVLEDSRHNHKPKGSTKQLCRLSSGNAIKVTMRFSAPKLFDLKAEKAAELKSALTVTLIGINTLLMKVDLVATVGSARLTLDVPPGKLHLSNDLITITVRNTGSLAGSWMVRFKDAQTGNGAFRVSSYSFEIAAAASISIKMFYQGPEDNFVENTLIFEEVNSGTNTLLPLSAGKDKSRIFPIKTSFLKMSWVHSGRKELSLKNFLDKKVHVKCKINGDGFYLDNVRGGGSNVITILTFGPQERRDLSIVYQPTSHLPSIAVLYLTLDKGMETSRKVLLYGSPTSEGMCWSGTLVTYGNTALVRALSRQPIELTLTNKYSVPAFMSASIHFNLQYRSAQATSSLLSPRRVVPARGSVTLHVHVDWARVERHAREAAASAALASVTLLTGAEVTRRRILKVINDNLKDTDICSLPPHLQQLVGPFDGEDPSMDDLLTEFDETKAALDELIGGIYELTAQIDIPQEFPEDNTILITDDTVLEHHTIAN